MFRQQSQSGGRSGLAAERACGVVAGPGGRKSWRGEPSFSLAVAGLSRRPTAYAVPVSSHGIPGDQGNGRRPQAGLSGTGRIGTRNPSRQAPPGSRGQRGCGARREASRTTRLAQACTRARQVPPTNDRVSKACPQAVTIVEQEVLPCILKTVIQHPNIPMPSEKKNPARPGLAPGVSLSSFELLATRLGMRSKTSYKFFARWSRKGSSKSSKVFRRISRGVSCSPGAARPSSRRPDAIFRTPTPPPPA